MLELALHFNLKCLCPIMVIVTSQRSDTWWNWLSSVNVFLFFSPDYLFPNLISTLNFRFFFSKNMTLVPCQFFVCDSCRNSQKALWAGSGLWGRGQTKLKPCHPHSWKMGRDMKPTRMITMRKTVLPKYKDNCKLREKNTMNGAILKLQIH